jgi:hypothetical protein
MQAPPNDTADIGEHMTKKTVEIKNFYYILVFQLVNILHCQSLGGKSIIGNI